MSLELLHKLADEFEAKAGVSNQANMVAPGYWLRIALAAEAMASNLPSKLFTGGQGVWYDIDDSATLFKEYTTGVVQAVVGDQVALILDKSKSAAIGADVKDEGAIGLVGTATAATYNTATGEGTATRAADGNNQSYIAWTELTPNSWYKIVIENTTTGIGVLLRSGAYNGGFWSVAPGSNTTSTHYVLSSSGGDITLLCNNNNQTVNFIVHSFEPVAGNHAYQSTAGSRAYLRQNAETGAKYLEFDGTDDSYITGAVDFTATDEVTLFAGLQRAGPGTTEMMVELSVSSTANAGTFALFTTVSGVSFRSVGSSALRDATASGLAPPASVIITGLGKISTDTDIIRANGVQASANAGDQGSGTYGNYPLYIGRRGGASLPFNGHLYALLIIDRVASADEIALTEDWLARKQGITL